MYFAIGIHVHVVRLGGTPGSEWNRGSKEEPESAAPPLRRTGYPPLAVPLSKSRLLTSDPSPSHRSARPNAVMSDDSKHESDSKSPWALKPTAPARTCTCGYDSVHCTVLARGPFSASVALNSTCLPVVRLPVSGVTI